MEVIGCEIYKCESTVETELWLENSNRRIV